MRTTTMSRSTVISCRAECRLGTLMAMVGIALHGSGGITLASLRKIAEAHPFFLKDTY
jgi:hypothetical protein